MECEPNALFVFCGHATILGLAEMIDDEGERR
jgi:hypothetical protein